MLAGADGEGTGVAGAMMARPKGSGVNLQGSGKRIELWESGSVESGISASTGDRTSGFSERDRPRANTGDRASMVIGA